MLQRVQEMPVVLVQLPYWRLAQLVEVELMHFRSLVYHTTVSIIYIYLMGRSSCTKMKKDISYWGRIPSHTQMQESFPSNVFNLTMLYCLLIRQHFSKKNTDNKNQFFFSYFVFGHLIVNWNRSFFFFLKAFQVSVKLKFLCDLFLHFHGKD